MQFIGLVLILVGATLINFVVKNRNPVDFVKAIVDDPTDVTGTLRDLEGKWQVKSDGESPVPNSGAKNPNTDIDVDVRGENGRLPDTELARIPWAFGYRVHVSALPSLIKLNEAYRAKFGKSLTISSAYRTYAEQARLYKDKPGLAAPPGKSNHGFGLAVDFGGGVNEFGTAEHEWMRHVGATFGWHLPSWAQRGGSRPEPWHFEFGTST